MVTEINNHVPVTSKIRSPEPVSAVSKIAATDKGQQHNAAKAETAAVPDSAVAPIDEGKVSKAVEDLNRHAEIAARNLNFSIHESSGRTVIKVVDRETDKVVRVIPPETVLEIAEIIQQTNDFNSTGLAEEA